MPGEGQPASLEQAESHLCVLPSPLGRSMCFQVSSLLLPTLNRSLDHELPCRGESGRKGSSRALTLKGRAAPRHPGLLGPPPSAIIQSHLIQVEPGIFQPLSQRVGRDLREMCQHNFRIFLTSVLPVWGTTQLCGQELALWGLSFLI